jgi:flagellin
LEAALANDGFTITRTAAGINISRADGANFTVTTSDASVDAVIGIASGTTSTNGVASTPRTVDQLVTEINTNLADKVRASNDNGKLRIENLSTAALTLTGVTAAGVIDGSATTGTIGGNDVRRNLVKQFNELRDQLNKLADDASFNGVNLLRGDKLKITFNETGTSTMEILAKEPDGTPTSINATTLKIAYAQDADFDSDSHLDDRLDTLQEALNTLRSHSSSFGSNLSIVQNRQTFTKAMINTLETGADNLVLADSNEEGANMLALQTRQQLSTTALSLSAQADQAVLRLFG